MLEYCLTCLRNTSKKDNNINSVAHLRARVRVRICMCQHAICNLQFDFSFNIEIHYYDIDIHLSGAKKLVAPNKESNPKAIENLKICDTKLKKELGLILRNCWVGKGGLSSTLIISTTLKVHIMKV